MRKSEGCVVESSKNKGRMSAKAALEILTTEVQNVIPDCYHRSRSIQLLKTKLTKSHTILHWNNGTQILWNGILERHEESSSNDVRHSLTAHPIWLLLMARWIILERKMEKRHNSLIHHIFQSGITFFSFATPPITAYESST